MNSLDYLLLSLPLWIGSAIWVLIPTNQVPPVRGAIAVYGCCVIVLTARVFLRKQYIAEIGWLFLLLGHVIWFALPALYQIVVPDAWFGDWIGFDIPDKDLFKASLFISLFLLSNGIGYWFFHSRRRVSPQNTLPKEALVKHFDRVTVVSILLLLGFIPYIFFGVSRIGLSATIAQVLLGRADKAWSLSSVEAYGGNSVNTIFWISRAFLVAAGVLAGLYIVVGKGRLLEKTLYLFILGVVGTLLYYDQGTRSILILAFLPIASYLLLAKNISVRDFDATKLAMMGGVLGVSLLLITQYQLYYRVERTRDQIDQLKWYEILSPKEQTDFFSETAIAVMVRDTKLQGNLHESPLLLFLVNPIPRSLWPDKPVSDVMHIYSLHRWGIDIWEKGGNALPSVVGQYYMGWGLPGIGWIGLVYGMIAAWFESFAARQRTHEHLITAISGLTFMLLSFRFLSPGFHYSTLALLLVLWFYRATHFSQVSQ